MSADGKMEKRRFLRVPCEAMVKIICEDRPFENEVLNISKGGLRIMPDQEEVEKIEGKRVCMLFEGPSRAAGQRRTNRDNESPQTALSEAKSRFDTSGKAVWALGKVAYSKLSKPGRCLGIEFTFLNREHQAAIEKMVQLGMWRSMRMSYV